MNEIYESLKGFTDIPIALFALVLGIISAVKFGCKYRWSVLFYIISVSAVFGTVVHAISMKPILLDILWVVLYILLYEAIRRFSHILTDYITGKQSSENRCIVTYEAVLYAVTVVLMFVANVNEIIVFVIFSATMFIRVIVCLFRSKDIPSKAYVLLAVLIFPLLLQAFENLIPYAVVIEHIILLFGMAIAYLICKEMASAE